MALLRTSALKRGTSLTTKFDLTPPYLGNDAR